MLLRHDEAKLREDDGVSSAVAVSVLLSRCCCLGVALLSQLCCLGVAVSALLLVLKTEAGRRTVYDDTVYDDTVRYSL